MFTHRNRSCNRRVLKRLYYYILPKKSHRKSQHSDSCVPPNRHYAIYVQVICEFLDQVFTIWIIAITYIYIIYICVCVYYILLFLGTKLTLILTALKRGSPLVTRGEFNRCCYLSNWNKPHATNDMRSCSHEWYIKNCREHVVQKSSCRAGMVGRVYDY